MAEIPQVPFDMGAPPPELPQGSTALPVFNPEDTQASPVVDFDTLVQEQRLHGPHGRADFEMISSAEEKALILKYWPTVWMSVVDNRMITTMYSMYQRAEFLDKEARKNRNAAPPPVGSAATGVVYVEWERQCQLRKAWINGKVEEWHRRVAAAKAANEQWKSYVAEARLDYINARDTPPPPRPVHG